MLLRLFFACSLLLVYMTSPVWAATFEETLLAAEQGDAVAQGILGIMYAEGRGVPQDDKEALKWLRFAAEHGDARAD